MFLYPAADDPRTTASFALNAPLAARRQKAESSLYEASKLYEDFVESTIAQDNAKGEAYRRWIEEIQVTTGRALTNPMQATQLDWANQQPIEALTAETDPLAFRNWRDGVEKKFKADVDQIAADFPDKQQWIYAGGETIDQRAQKVAVGAREARDAALREAGEVGAGTFVPSLAGSFVGMARDPVQVGALFVGGGIAAPAKTVTMKIIQTMLTEAVINAGVETALVASSESWRAQTGAEHGLGSDLQRIGLAALFGGAVGGLGRGAVEAFRVLGREAPEEILQRVVSGQARPGDVQKLADAAGVKLEPQTAKVAAIAAEQGELDAAAFGRPPEGVNPAEAERGAAQAIRAMEEPPDLVPGGLHSERDLVGPPPRTGREPRAFDQWRPLEVQDRAETIDRIAKDIAPAGGRFDETRPPPSLLEFLHNQGGIRPASELQQLGADTWKKTEKVGGKKGFSKDVFLVRDTKGARSLDYAREIAEEAGYLQTPSTGTTTVDDLLQAIQKELAGDPVFSVQDAARLSKYEAWLSRRANREATERVLGDIDGAIAEHGRMPPDKIIRDTLRIMGDEDLSADAALERAIEDDYRGLTTEPDDGGPKLPEPDAGTMPGAGGRTGDAGEGGAEPAAGAADRDGGGEFPVPGDRQGTGRPESFLDAWRRKWDELDEFIEASRAERLNPPGNQVEPASTEAVEAADLALLEARGTPEPAAKADEPVERSDWDYLPAGTNPDGSTRYATYDDMIADADRDDEFSSLIASCKL